MPRVNWNEVKEASGLIPDGTYLMRVSECNPVESKSGNEMWNLLLTVCEGEHAGFEVRDRLVFAEKALPRVKLVVSRLGIETSGEMDLMPNMLVGKMARVTTVQEDYEKTGGGKGRTVKVPFDGYESLEEDAGTDDDSIPF